VDGIAAGPGTAEPQAIDPEAGQGGEGRTPRLALDGFSGKLEWLLALARARQVDLGRLSLPDLLDQLAAALHNASGAIPLTEQGDWVVMAAWLLLLRSRLLLPADTPAQRKADAEADRLRQGLVGLGQMQALARWLDGRPRLGRDVFARGQPERVGLETATAHEVDVIEFLWASLALFYDDLPAGDMAASYRPVWLDLHAISDARDRILRLLADAPDGRSLDGLLPEPLDADATAVTQTDLRARSRWTSTFVAGLELAKQGDVALAQEEAFSSIHVSLPFAGLPA